MVTPHPFPLDLTYAALFGTPPGPEIATALSRLERYVGSSLTPATALLLCITLRPIDLYTNVIAAAERQLHDARLLFGTAVTEMRSTEALTIALQNETIRRLSEENRTLRRVVVVREADTQDAILTTAMIFMLFIAALGICWVGLLS